MKLFSKTDGRQGHALPSALLSAVVLAAFFALLLHPARYLACVSDGISLWAVSVLPAALPFLFLTGLLAQTPLFSRIARMLAPCFSRLFGVSGAGGCAALLSLMSGYPAGAKTLQGLCRSGAIAKEERLACACLASTSGPAFLVGVAGTTMAGSPALGWLLFASHVLGIFGISLLLRGRKKVTFPSAGANTADGRRADIPETLASSVLSVLTVGGAVALFYALGCMLCDALAPLALPKSVSALLAGLVEMTAGCASLLADPTPAKLALSAFLVTFGGACVLVQQWSFLRDAEIAFGKFILIKAAQGALAAAVCYLLALAAGI